MNSRLLKRAERKHGGALKRLREIATDIVDFNFDPDEPESEDDLFALEVQAEVKEKFLSETGNPAIWAILIPLILDIVMKIIEQRRASR